MSVPPTDTVTRSDPALTPDGLIAPHGGALVDAMLSEARRAEVELALASAPRWRLTPRQLADLELLLSGAFSPLTGYLGPLDHESVLSWMRLADGTLWPVPVNLDVPLSLVRTLQPGQRLGLEDANGQLLASVNVQSVWLADREAEAGAVYGTRERSHPGVRALLDATHPYYVGGRVEGLTRPTHTWFPRAYHTPVELRAEIRARGWQRVVAFQTRNPMHRAHDALTRRAAREADAGLLLHPAVGPTQPGDLDPHVRMRCYQALLGRSERDQDTLLSLLPLAMRMAGPREALWHAIIRKNHGATHFIVGRDHAGPRDDDGQPCYDPYAAQQLVARHADELGITMVPFRKLVYVQDLDDCVPEDEVRDGQQVIDVSGSELRASLRAGQPIPEGFTYPEVERELRRAVTTDDSAQPAAQTGFTVFLTGLSGAGKSTIADALAERLEIAGRTVSLLDGDEVRTFLSSELGFSREHRDLNVRRTGWVASEIARHGGIAICALIAPYDDVRRQVRARIEEHSGMLLVHVATPLAECERRDPKGLYARARAGELPAFTGISDPYEAPEDAELVIDTSDEDVAASVECIIRELVDTGLLSADA